MNLAAGTDSAQSVHGPSRLKSPVTNGAPHVLPPTRVSQKIDCSTRLSPVVAFGLRPTFSESWGCPDPPSGLGPLVLVL